MSEHTSLLEQWVHERHFASLAPRIAPIVAPCRSLVATACCTLRSALEACRARRHSQSMWAKARLDRGSILRVRSACRLCRTLASLAAAACGDVGDASIPLPIGQRAAAAPPAAPAAAAVIVLDSSGSGESCAERRLLLPDAGARDTLVSSQGERARDGSDLALECSVTPAGRDAAAAFDVRARVRRPGGVELRATGQVAPGQGTLTLELAMGALDSVQATCRGEVREVLPGALWLPVLDCTVAPASDASACSLQGGLLLEHCQR